MPNQAFTTLNWFSGCTRKDNAYNHFRNSIPVLKGTAP